MVAGRRDKARGHVVAEKRNFRDVGSILDLLFSEYPSVVWTPNGMPGRSMLSCAPKSATLPVKVEGWSSQQRAGWACEGHLTRIGHLNCQHRVVSDCRRGLARHLLDDRPSSTPAAIIQEGAGQVFTSLVAASRQLELEHGTLRYVR
jgi:hypothetical protein